MRLKEAIKRLRALAVTFGATLDVQEGGRQDTVNVDAPAGKVWRANGCHVIVLQLWVANVPAYNEWNADALKDAQERIDMGLAVCEDADCDVCEEARS